SRRSCPSCTGRSLPAHRWANGVAPVLGCRKPYMYLTWKGSTYGWATTHRRRKTSRPVARRRRFDFAAFFMAIGEGLSTIVSMLAPARPRGQRAVGQAQERIAADGRTSRLRGWG